MKPDFWEILEPFVDWALKEDFGRGTIQYPYPLNEEEIQRVSSFLRENHCLQSEFVVNETTTFIKIYSYECLPRSIHFIPKVCINCQHCTKVGTYVGGPGFFCLKYYKRKERPRSFDELSSDEISERHEGKPDFNILDYKMLESLSKRDGNRFHRRLLAWAAFQARFRVYPNTTCDEFK